MDIIDCLEWRYATKKFDSKVIITDDKIERLKKAFNLTASSYGLQPVKLVVISNKKLQSRLTEHSMNQQQIAQASHVFLFCIESKIDTAYINTFFERIKSIRNTPDDILNPFKEFLIDDFNKKSIDDIRLWATKQAYLALGNMLTVCAVEGIDACPMEGFVPQEYDKVLDLNKKGLQSVLLMPIGHRAKDDMFADFKKVRKDINESILEL